MIAALHRATRPSAVLLALVVALGSALGGLVAGPVAGPVASLPMLDAPVVRAAETDLTLVTNARYVVDPAHQRVRVTVDITATNHRAETKTHRYYFDRAFLAVLPGTSGFRITGTTKPKVAVSKRTSAYTMLRLTFGSRLYGGKSATFRLTFDLVDPGGKPDRQVRVGDSLVSFPIWAFASDGATGSTASVSFPKGYEVSFESGNLPNHSTADDGSSVYATGRLREPLKFFAYAVAEREGSTKDVALTVPVRGDDVRLSLRAWADDPAWAKRIGDLFTKALPVLGEEIGLPWPRTEPLVVEESISRSAGGYAGVFDPSEGRTQVAYWAPPIVVVHEAAHGWFNGGLLADRWANEAFAAHYADLAAAAVDVPRDAQALTDELLKSRIPLNAWGPAGQQDGPEETYAYAASRRLAALVADRAGEDALRQVWQWAASHTAAYADPARPAASLEGEAPGAPDWRGLLDLLEEATGKRFDDLWREWVVRDEEAALLDARAAARQSLERTQRLAGSWALPPAAREAMRSWQFDGAEQVLADARTVLAQHTAVEEAAKAAGLRLPDTVRTLFEQGDLVRASEVARTQYSAIQTLQTAGGYRPANPDALTTLGLLGTQPEVALARAHDEFAKGDVDAALASASDAQATWTGAWEQGRRRALLAVVVVAAALLLLLAVGARLRSARRARLAAATAAPATTTDTGEAVVTGTDAVERAAEGAPEGSAEPAAVADASPADTGTAPEDPAGSPPAV